MKSIDAREISIQIGYFVLEKNEENYQKTYKELDSYRFHNIVI